MHKSRASKCWAVTPDTCGSSVRTCSWHPFGVQISDVADFGKPRFQLVCYESRRTHLSGIFWPPSCTALHSWWMQRTATACEVPERASKSKQQTHKPIILMQHPVLHCYCVQQSLPASDATKMSKFHKDFKRSSLKQHQISLQILYKTHVTCLWAVNTPRSSTKITWPVPDLKLIAVLNMTTRAAQRF